MGDEKCAAIRFENVQYAYPGNSVFLLDAPRLSFAFGTCAAIRGHNGSGKTTLGKLVAGLLRPSRGRVFVGETDMTDWPLAKIGSQVGYLFQEPSRQIFAPTVMEEITFPLTLKGMDKQRARELALSMLAQFEMAPLAEATTFTLSRGEKQRLAIAAMLVNHPSFLTLDEPTTGLDTRRKGILGDMIKRLTDQGVGILLISHDAAFVREHAAIVYHMEKGKIV